MVEEYFWGLTLEAGDSASGSWDPENDAADGSKYGIQSDETLVIRQAVLGAKAKPDELNIVEVSVMGFNKSLKIPVIRLKVGEQTQTRLDLTFPDPPVTFTLVEGSGPVHITGNIGVGGPSGPLNELEEEEDEVDDDLDEEEDENNEESEDDLQKTGDKKRKMVNANGKNKKSKLDETNEELDDDEDLKKKKIAAGKKDKPKKK